MIDGEIEDEYGEFFIVENLSENDWNNSHALRLAKNITEIIQTSIFITYINFDIVQLTR